MVIVLIVVLIMCFLMVYSLALAAGRADRMWDQLLFESQSQEGGDSSVG